MKLISEDQDVIQGLPTGNLLQEIAIIDQHIETLSQKESGPRNQEVLSYLRDQAVALRFEFSDLLHFLRNGFHLDLNSEEEATLAGLFFEIQHRHAPQRFQHDLSRDF